MDRQPLISLPASRSWRQPRFIDRPAQEVREAQFPRPFIEIGAVQRRALDFEDTQHVGPLAVGHLRYLRS